MRRAEIWLGPHRSPWSDRPSIFHAPRRCQQPVAAGVFANRLRISRYISWVLNSLSRSSIPHALRTVLLKAIGLFHGPHLRPGKGRNLHYRSVILNKSIQAVILAEQVAVSRLAQSRTCGCHSTAAHLKLTPGKLKKLFSVSSTRTDSSSPAGSTSFNNPKIVLQRFSVVARDSEIRVQIQVVWSIGRSREPAPPHPDRNQITHHCPFPHQPGRPPHLQPIIVAVAVEDCMHLPYAARILLSRSRFDLHSDRLGGKITAAYGSATSSRHGHNYGLEVGGRPG